MYRFVLWENAALLTASRYRKYRFGLDLQEVHPNGFEPLTFGSVDRCSIQLSYGCARVALAARLMRDIVTQGSAFGKRGLGFLD